jgi:hypothetical protein
MLLVLGPIYALLWGALSVFGGLLHRQTRMHVRHGAELAFADEGIGARGALGEVRLNWEACTSAIELRETFVLTVGLEQWMLPRASFPPGDVERFRALLRDRLGDRAKLARISAS